jgi:hypothetical protein
MRGTVLVAPASPGEGGRDRLLFVELGRPGPLEVDGIDEKHDRSGVDGAVHDLLDFALGLGLHPAVDDPGSPGIGEVQGTGPGVEKELRALQEVGPHGEALAVPDGVPDPHLHLGIQVQEKGHEVLVALVDLIPGHDAEAQDAPHLVEGGSGGAVHGHAQGHGGAQWSQEDAGVRG